MKRTYSEEEVLALIVKERERSVSIIRAFQKKHNKIYWEKRKVGNEFAFVNKDILETCRLIANEVEGISLLNNTIENKVKENLEKWQEEIQKKEPS